MKHSYRAIIEVAKEGFTGYFPEIPGCFAVEDNLDDLKRSLPQILAIHLYMLENRYKNPISLSEPLREALDSNQQEIEVIPAEVNPVSFAIKEVIEETGLSLRQLESKSGISSSVLSRMQNPFYWGHSMNALRHFSEAFGYKTVVNFEPIHSHAAD